MPRKVPHLLERDGRYFARKVLTSGRHPEVKKRDYRQPLGGDRRVAIAQLPAALVLIDDEIEKAIRAAGGSGASAGARAPMTVVELARTHYAQRLALDEAARNSGPLWASMSIDDGYVAALRGVLAGRLSDDETDRVLGEALHRFRAQGYLAAAPRTPEWREAARALADAEVHALERTIERDEGVSPAAQQHPAHLVIHEPPESAPEAAKPAVSLRGLMETHIGFLEKEGRGREARKVWPRVFEHLIDFLMASRGLTGKKKASADNALLLTDDELIAWRDLLLEKLAPKTVKGTWVAAVKRGAFARK